MHLWISAVVLLGCLHNIALCEAGTPYSNGDSPQLDHSRPRRQVYGSGEPYSTYQIPYPSDTYLPPSNDQAFKPSSFGLINDHVNPNSIYPSYTQSSFRYDHANGLSYQTYYNPKTALHTYAEIGTTQNPAGSFLYNYGPPVDPHDSQWNQGQGTFRNTQGNGISGYNYYPPSVGNLPWDPKEPGSAIPDDHYSYYGLPGGLFQKEPFLPYPQFPNSRIPNTDYGLPPPQIPRDYLNPPLQPYGGLPSMPVGGRPPYSPPYVYVTPPPLTPYGTTFGRVQPPSPDHSSTDTSGYTRPISITPTPTETTTRPSPVYDVPGHEEPKR